MKPDSGLPNKHARIANASSALLQDAKCLLDLAVEAVARSNAGFSRAQVLIDRSQQHRAERDVLIRESRIARTQLKGAVTAFTRELRATGEPPEKILRRLRRLVTEAKVERLQSDAAASLMEDVLHWG